MNFSVERKTLSSKALVLVAALACLASLALFGCASTGATNSADAQTQTTSEAEASASTAPEAESSSTPASTVEVVITDDSCEVTPAEVGSGVVTFNVVNSGTQANEFEILAEDRLQIVSERENITPGQPVEVTVILEPGHYYTASKTNMVGALVDVRDFNVVDSGVEIEVSADEQEMRDEAVKLYTAYIQDQAGQLIAATQSFVDTYKAGDFENARELYAPTRMYYERIEPTAEAFGDIDPALDYREADLNEGDTWTANDDTEHPWGGWHKIEKDLWKDSKDTWLEGNEDEDYTGLSDEERAQVADQLMADTQKLYDMVTASDFEVGLDDISNGAIGLLEEVATSKISGEEEAFSRTDLWDFQANVEGAMVAYGNVKKIAEMKDPELVQEIQSQLDTMNELLAKYGSAEAGYKYYNELSDEEIRELSDQVNALRNPLAQLTSTVLGIAPAEDSEE